MAAHFDVTAGYAAVFIYSIASIILAFISIHLIITARKHRKADDDGSTLFCLVVTTIGNISFQITVLLIIAVLMQVILIDGHKLHPESNPFDKFYYMAFEEMEYCIGKFYIYLSSYQIILPYIHTYTYYNIHYYISSVQL